MKNYFYLVGYQYDETFVPLKVFLNREEAINWGRTQATLNKSWCADYYLMAQEITKEATLRRVKPLTPYPNKKTQPKQVTPVESFDWDAFDTTCEKPVKGADFDIDVRRP